MRRNKNNNNKNKSKVLTGTSGSLRDMASETLDCASRLKEQAVVSLALSMKGPEAQAMTSLALCLRGPEAQAMSSLALSLKGTEAQAMFSLGRRCFYSSFGLLVDRDT